VALAAVVKGDKREAKLGEHFHVHPTQITEWKQLLARAAHVFGGTKPSSEGLDLEGAARKDVAIDDRESLFSSCLGMECARKWGTGSLGHRKGLG
jgi:hypothetical protein